MQVESKCKDFTGYAVKSKSFPYLDGRVVVQTVKQLKCRNSNSFLYEVKLNHTERSYFLYENEMKKL